MGGAGEGLSLRAVWCTHPDPAGVLPCPLELYLPALSGRFPSSSLCLSPPCGPGAGHSKNEPRYPISPELGGEGPKGNLPAACPGELSPGIPHHSVDPSLPAQELSAVGRQMERGAVSPQLSVGRAPQPSRGLASEAQSHLPHGHRDPRCLQRRWWTPGAAGAAGRPAFEGGCLGQHVQSAARV